MDLDLDSGTILYAVGVLFGILALAYFLSDVVFGLSITVRAALLGFTFLAFLVAGLAVERDVLDLVAFALSAAAYVAFVWYVVARYDVGRTGTFLAFAASAALFVGLGFAVHERGLTVSRRTAAIAVLGLVLVSALLVGADAVDGEVAYEADLESTVAVDPVSDEGPDHAAPVEASVGTLTATNHGVFTRPLDWPRVTACVAGTDGFDHADVRSEWTGSSRDLLRGGQTVQQPLQFTGRLLESADAPSSLAVERASSCDVERAEPTLLVLIGEERPARAV